MRKRKCDRCGKDVYSPVMFDPVVIKGHLVDENTVKEIWVNTDKYSRCQLELCDDCAKSFADWFNNA